uniref:RNA-directed DNA polymerase n=1 Tax=Tanacetum cinerariifolium TaxID=118510 RepID=A0A6L2LPV6_TANCI|nr:reverse transcriptase domain-containing protein [Tanacetum cinerariifolium]
MPQECLKIIESKSKVCQSRAKAVVAKVSTSSSTPAVSTEVAELKDMVTALLLDKKNQSSSPASSFTPAPVKAVELNCVTCGGTQSYQNCFRPQMVANQIRPPGFPPHQNHQNNFNLGNNFNQNRGGNFNQSNFNQGGNFNQGQLHRPQVNQPPSYQASAYQALIPQTQSVFQTDFESYIKANDAVLRNMQSQGSGTFPSNTITNPKEDLKGITTQSGVAYQGPTIPTPPKVVKQGTKLSEMARTPMNEHCSVVILNKLPRKLGDPGKFLIPCKFLGMDKCLALVDLGASINLMPLSIWEGLSLLELTSTCMTLELADRSVSKPIGIAKDVSVKVGVFHFPADFVVIDFEPDPRPFDQLRLHMDCQGGNSMCTPLVLLFQSFQAAKRDLGTYKDRGTERDGLLWKKRGKRWKKRKVDTYQEYSQEVLGFLDVTASGNPTPYDDPIVSTTSPTLTPFTDNDFLLFKEADTFLSLEEDPNLPEFNPFYYDPEGDILLLEAILNSEPLPPLPKHEQYLPSFKKELKVYEAKTVKSSVDEPPEVELKDLPPHVEYAFLEGDNKLPVIIAKELGDEEKSALIKILMEEDYKPAVQHQRRVNPKIHDVIKKEVGKLLDARLIYPISDSPWVSPVHCVPKKGGFTLIENEENELIPTRLVTGWRTMEVFMDDFSVFGNSFENCLSRLDKMLQRCEDTNLSLNWEKSHFMVKEGIVLGHKISKNGIEAGRAKVDVIAKLPHLTTVKDCIKAFQTLKKKLTEVPILIAPNWDLPFKLMCDASDFAIGAVLGQRHEKHFRPIQYASKMMNDAESNYTTTEKEMLAIVYAFEKFRSYLIMNKRIVHTDHSALKYLFAKKDAKARLLRWVLLLQEFDFKVLDTKGAENLAADHLSRLENPYENVLDLKGINETFPLETLSMVTFRGDFSAPWFVDFANYHAGNFIVKVSSGLPFTRMHTSLSKTVTRANDRENFYNVPGRYVARENPSTVALNYLTETMCARRCRPRMLPGKVSHSSFFVRCIPGDMSPGKPILGDKSSGIPWNCRWGKWTFCSLLVAEVDKGNLNPLEQMRTIEQLRQ